MLHLCLAVHRFLPGSPLQTAYSVINALQVGKMEDEKENNV